VVRGWHLGIERLALVGGGPKDDKLFAPVALNSPAWRTDASVVRLAIPAMMEMSVVSSTVSRMRTLSPWLSCGPSPESTLIASATDP
jgi:hypothetical protein